MSKWARFSAVTGPLFAVCLTASFITGGSTPGSDATGKAVITFYKDNQHSQMASAVLGAVAVIFFIFFAAFLWNRLRTKFRDSPLPAAGLVGGALIGVGGSLFSAMTFCLTDVPDKLDPSAAQALNVLNNDIFFPFACGACLYLIANGLLVARGGMLPRWLGWVAIVIGVIAVTPLGFAAVIGFGLWTLVVSVIMLVRDLRSEPAVALGTT